MSHGVPSQRHARAVVWFLLNSEAGGPELGRLLSDAVLIPLDDGTFQMFNPCAHSSQFAACFLRRVTEQRDEQDLAHVRGTVEEGDADDDGDADEGRV